MSTLTPTPSTSSASTSAEAGRASTPGAEKAWLIVARREVMAKLTDRAFLVGTLVTIALIGGVMGVQAYLGQRTKTFEVAATSSAVTMVQQVKSGAGAIDDKVIVNLVPVGSDDAARAAVTGETADAWLHQVDGAWTLTGKSEVDSGLSRVVTEVVRGSVLAQNAQAAGTTMEVLTKGTTVAVTQLEGDAAKSDFGRGLGAALAILFYLASLTFGLTLASSVLEEKASRIVEIITTKIPVRHLLIGKILGNTALAMGQMVLFAVVALIGISFTPYAAFLSAASAAIGWFIVFFVVGFLLISCLWAVAGSLASRSEDLQQTSTPVTMLMVLMFFGSLLLKGTWLTVASFVPPFSAIAMPVRVAQGGAAWWEPLVALALLIAGAAIIIRFAERLYSRSLLQTQGRLSIKQAWTTAE